MKKTILSMFVVLTSIFFICLSASAARRARPPEREDGQDGRPPEQWQRRNAKGATGSAIKVFSGSQSKNLQKLLLQSSKNDETALCDT